MLESIGQSEFALMKSALNNFPVDFQRKLLDLNVDDIIDFPRDIVSPFLNRLRSYINTVETLQPETQMVLRSIILKLNEVNRASTEAEIKQKIAEAIALLDTITEILPESATAKPKSIDKETQMNEALKSAENSLTYGEYRQRFTLINNRMEQKRSTKSILTQENQIELEIVDKVFFKPVETELATAKDDNKASDDFIAQCYILEQYLGIQPMVYRAEGAHRGVLADAIAKVLINDQEREQQKRQERLQTIQAKIQSLLDKKLEPHLIDQTNVKQYVEKRKMLEYLRREISSLDIRDPQVVAFLNLVEDLVGIERRTYRG